MAQISWHKQERRVVLSGVLDRLTLARLWAARRQVLTSMQEIEVSDLSRVDSAGLALLVNCCLNFNLKLVGVNPQLQTLIQLYNLDKVIPTNDK